MNHRAIAMVAGLLLTLTVLLAGPAQADGQDSLRHEVIGWLDANYLNKYPDTTAKVRKQVDDDLTEEGNFVLTFGPGVTKTGKPFIVVVFDGQLYKFELSMDQMRRAVSGPDRVKYMFAGRGNYKREADRRISVKGPQFNSASSIDPRQPMTGKLAFTGKLPGEFAVRMTYHLDEKTTGQAFHHVDNAPASAQGTIPFTFGPIQKEGKAKIGGPVVVFLDLCTITQEPFKNLEIKVFTNSVAVLLDLRE